MKLIDIRRRIAQSLSGVTPDSTSEALRIVSELYSIDPRDIPLKLFDDFEENAEVDKVIERRRNGEPLEYIFGKAVFCGLDFSVSCDCLIPQADTEVVVEAARSHLSKGGRFADLCTGSGCIAVSIAKFSGASGIAVDISAKALEIAAKNAESNGVSSQINFINADILKSEDYFDEKYDVIVSNPPYIKTDVIDTLSEEVKHEPRIALDGGIDGLDFYKRLIEIAPRHLKPSGHLILEIGYDEAEDVSKILDKNNFIFNVIKDFGGNDRCIDAILKN